MNEQREPRPLVVPRVVVGMVAGLVRLTVRLVMGTVRAVWAVLPKWLKIGFYIAVVMLVCWLGVKQPWHTWFY